jgi:catechol 2,3-dioxygenase-like lactoylglutathione lyase family enzyme
MTEMFQAVHPVLGSSDVRRSIRFYERLGFSLTFEDDPLDPKYAAVVREAVELHLQWQSESPITVSTDRPTYRFVVRDVDRLYAEFQKGGVVQEQASGSSPWLAPGDTPWGTREFHLRDPDGNGLQFYRARGAS